MKLYVGAPVAERGWVLPSWWDCLAKQTRQPDGYLFVYSHSEDDTLQQLHEGAPEGADLRVFHTKRPFYSRQERNLDASDPQRSEHFSKLRNLLRRELLETDADLFLSLDTDVLMEDPTVIQRLEETLLGPKLHKPNGPTRWDVLAPITYLHPWGRESRCYNAGHLGGGYADKQIWQRVEFRETLQAQSPFPIDVPCAVFLATRHVMGMCGYHAHPLGEDVGFGQELKSHGMRVGYCTDMEVRHVWDQGFLEKREPVAS